MWMWEIKNEAEDKIKYSGEEDSRGECYFSAGLIIRYELVLFDDEPDYKPDVSDIYFYRNGVLKEFIVGDELLRYYHDNQRTPLFYKEKTSQPIKDMIMMLDAIASI